MNRIQYLDSLRLFAILGVIHVHSTYKFDLSSCYQDWLCSCVRDCAPRWIIPDFVMLSGVFMLNPKKVITLKENFTLRIPRFLIAYVSWWLIYCLYKVGIGVVTNNLKISIDILLPEVHLWFLPLIIGLYLMLPFFRIINQDSKLTRYYLIVWLAFTSVEFFLPFVGFSIETIRPLYGIYLFSGYMFLGYQLFHIELSKKQKVLIYVGGVVGCVVSIIGTFALSDFPGPNHPLFTQNIGPCLVMMSMAVFLFFKDFFEEERSWMVKLNEYVRKDLFGIYLVHILWLDIFSRIIFRLELSWIISSIPLSVLSFVFSLYSVKIIRLIPYLRNIVK